jgi:hypothetical protein
MSAILLAFCLLPLPRHHDAELDPGPAPVAGREVVKRDVQPLRIVLREISNVFV